MTDQLSACHKSVSLSLGVCVSCLLLCAVMAIPVIDYVAREPSFCFDLLPNFISGERTRLALLFRVVACILLVVLGRLRSFGGYAYGT